ncbi:flagellar motor switch protein [Sulfitobacter sp. JBTF-M27]|uniref:Flagellar motor switch protein n=1 Tax=Sulfitobacter sediminilitoris TaxID=2698830 RepID=A0A6P0CEP7_9RHOB|nr:flagellar motor switch protein [Sulfitobacter sediminilitoris]NEK23840.1 flagellar motor switch protein [Sulfitobacter sediminilitoris]
MAAIIDGVIIVLLIGSITYGYLVSRKVRLLMATLRELEPLVDEFSSAVDKSQTSVAEMRRNIEVAEEAPQPQAAPASAPEEAAFSSRRAAPPAPEIPGLRRVRDKKELVRAFFDSADTARV